MRARVQAPCVCPATFGHTCFLSCPHLHPYCPECDSRGAGALRQGEQALGQAQEGLNRAGDNINRGFRDPQGAMQEAMQAAQQASEQASGALK